MKACSTSVLAFALTLSAQTNTPKISGPFTHENLSVFLIHGPNKTAKSLLTLEEAIDERKVIVYETRDVNELAIENVSNGDVFIESGDIVKGGAQDRTLKDDLILPSKSGKVSISSFCVEHGRWTQRGSESVRTFDSSNQALATKQLKMAVKLKANQQEVWNQVAAAQAKVAGLKPVTVFDYDSGEAAPFTGAGLATPTALISLGGGTNIFASLKQSFTSVSWEQVIKADPQCIIINDYGIPTAAQKEKFLETSPITKKLTAVKNRCFLPLSYDEVTPSPRNAEAAVAIARWLHPSAFGLPADGS